MTKTTWYVLVDGDPIFSGSVRSANIVFNALMDSFEVVKRNFPDFVPPSVCFCKDIYGGA